MKCTDSMNERPSMYTEREWARIMEKEAAENKKQRHLGIILGLLFLVLLLMGYSVYYFVFRSCRRMYFLYRRKSRNG